MLTPVVVRGRSPFQKILIVGATGSIGSVMLRALLDEPTFTVTVLQRTSSNHQVADLAKVIKIDDSYPFEDLKAAFAGQDAVVNCTTTLAVREQKRFIDAAVAAKVRRFVASEYGLNNNNESARELCSVFREKGEIQDYLREQQSKGLEWMSIACGMWLKWSVMHEFLGMRLKEKKFVVWGNGQARFSCTTEENTALGLVTALSAKWKQTQNDVVCLCDFTVTQRQLLVALRRMGGLQLQVEKIDTDQFVAQKQAAVAAGDTRAVFDLVETGFVGGMYGANLKKEGFIMNENLNLPKRAFEDVMKEAIEAWKASQ